MPMRRWTDALFSLSGSTRLDPAIHPSKNILVRIDGYAGQARV
jgi:hypothetical protein